MDLVTGIVSAVVGGVVVWLVTRLGRAKVRLEIESSRPSVFRATRGVETTQTIVVANRGRATATKVLIKVSGLPEQEKFEHNVLGSEPTDPAEYNGGTLTVSVARLLPDDRVEIAFKFVSVDIDLQKVAVSARADQGRAEAGGLPRRPKQDTVLQQILVGAGVSVAGGTLLLAGVWTALRISNGASIIPESRSSRNARVRRMFDQGDIAHAARVLEESDPAADLDLVWLDSNSRGDTLYAAVSIVNNEPLPIDGGLLLWRTIAVRPASGLATLADGSCTSAVPALQTGASWYDTVCFCRLEGAASTAGKVQATYSYATLTVRRVIDRSLYFKVDY